MKRLEILTDRAVEGESLDGSELASLFEEDLDDLCCAADRIRKERCGDALDLCSIINGKNGRCSEDCKFCAQSGHYPSEVSPYEVMDTSTILEFAQNNERDGVKRFSIVTAGRALSAHELDYMVNAVLLLKAKTGLSICASFGLLNVDGFRRLKIAGLTRVHCNIETSREHFSEVCTTHSFEDKLACIRAAQSAGLEVCSGVLVGIGESEEDVVSMAVTLRGLGIKSIPVNMLNPIPHTPYADRLPLGADDLRRIMAIFRFANPDAFIRLAGGRGLLPDKGKSCLQSGANAIISGDFLTTSGYSIKSDVEMVEDMGFRIREV